MSRFKIIRPRIKRQSPYKGGRLPVNSAFIPPLEAAIRKEMVRFKVSRSFVIATATAFALGVEEQEDYRPTSKIGSGKSLTGARKMA